ncbi:MAG: type II toxin-antitoxin system RelE/ParE family toxin [Cyclobacteriaceae bacterium]
MRVEITSQSLDRLEESLRFYLEDLGVPLERVLSIKDDLLSKAKSLSSHPYKGQLEPYLAKLKKDHRRIIEGNFKIIYRIEGDVIYVTDFFDSRKDPANMKG